MTFKDYYAALGLDSSADQDAIKKAYRKLARKYHPDVSKEDDAESRFKEVNEAYHALNDPEMRAAYDDRVRREREAPQGFGQPPGGPQGYEFSGRDFGGRDARGHDFGAGEPGDYSDFFESLFGHQERAHAGQGRRRAASLDHHAKIEIELEDVYLGATRTISLSMPVVDAQGRVTMTARQLEITIPKGVREGQHLRLAGQGSRDPDTKQAGDLYLEIAYRVHPQFRVDGRDVYVDLPLAPWEAALGASVEAPTPEGPVELTIPPGSRSGRKLRLKARGLPGNPTGDLYVVLTIVAPSAVTADQKSAYEALARAYPTFDARTTTEAKR
ncbi:DnaJ C-terminal domain-containing protein [Alcaligenaceae bacterium A4P071]|nr:DnaJ C-terminal domain-containing protein [Alcaligenaceae bacterium A4P071]